jgi:hypothetical protein
MQATSTSKETMSWPNDVRAEKGEIVDQSRQSCSVCNASLHLISPGYFLADIGRR